MTEATRQPIKSQTDQLAAMKPVALVGQMERSNPTQIEPPGLRRNGIPTSADEDGGLTGRSRLYLPDFSANIGSSRTESTKIPPFIRKPVIRPTGPPVEAERDRVIDKNNKTGKFGRVIECLCTIANIESAGREAWKHLGYPN